MGDPEIAVEGQDSIFDPDHFVTTTALNGRRGVVTEAEFIRHNYNGKYPESTAFKVVVNSPDLEKPRTLLIGCGALRPSEDGKTPSLIGPFVVGAIEKSSNVADFLKFLKASGFPYETLGKKGADALVGAAFTFRAFEKKVSGEMKAYDVPAEFHGFEEVVQSGEATEVTLPSSAVANKEELEALARETVIKILKDRPNHEIARGQLSITVGPALAGDSRRVQVLGVLTQDSFLATIPGVTYDKKTLKLTE